MMRTVFRWIKNLFSALHGIWTAFGIVVLAVVIIEVVPDAWKGFWRTFDYEHGWKPDFRASSEGYDGAGWPVFSYREYWRQAATLDWHAYAYWRHRPMRGVYHTVDDNGLRRTWNKTPSQASGARPLRVFVFGGSTVFGLGARDAFTIPSLLSKRLAERSKFDVEVTNFGQAGYVGTQEVVALLEELKGGNVPDLAVFYDGVNEIFSALQNGAPGLPQNEGNRAREFNLTLEQRRFDLYAEALKRALARLTRRAAKVADLLGLDERATAGTGDPATLADGILDAYAENIRVVNALSGVYGFKALFFWQPVVYTKRHLTPHEERWQHWRGSREFYLTVYERMRGDGRLRALGNFTDVSGIFDDSEDSFFVDFNHVTERGNEVVADALLASVAAALEDVIGRGKGSGSHK